jgi:hypothetical protein
MARDNNEPMERENATQLEEVWDWGITEAAIRIRILQGDAREERGVRIAGTVRDKSR